MKNNLAVAEAEARDGSGELIAFANVKLIRIE
jgi:hypothetical protein